MQRIPTSFALSLWLGFYAVTGASELAGLSGMTTVFGHALEAPAASGWGGVFVAVLSLATAAVMAAALAELNSDDPHRVLRGEFLAFGGVGISSAMVLAGALFGVPFSAVFDRIDLALWSVGLSLLALAFDTCIHAPDNEDDEIAFRKALLSIDASIPREPRHPADEPGSQPAGER